MKHTFLLFLPSLLTLMLVTSCSSKRYPDDSSRYPYARTETDRDYRESRDRDLEVRDRERDRDRDRYRDRERDRDRDRDRDRGDRREDGRTYSFRDLDIPKGHLPPPGECKIWYPGKPPGQQLPPQSCTSALRNAPLGAWVISHEGSRYKVSIFNQNRRNAIDEVRYYQMD